MKTKIFTLLCLAFIFFCNNLSSNQAPADNKIPARAATTIYSSSELYNIAIGWANAYMAANPGQKINVIRLTDPGIEATISKNDNICFVSGEFPQAGNAGPGFRLDVGREIIVPVINPENPYMKEINQQGISAESLAVSLGKPGKMRWGDLLHNNQQSPVKYYILNDGLTVSKVEGFTKANLSAGMAVKCRSGQELVAAVQKDPLAIGFCRLTDIIRPGSSEFYENICLMPIDKNSNGKLDYMEKIYGNFSDFTRGVWIGKYPNALTGQICCVGGSKPADEAEVAFLQWVLSSGQDLLPEKGYCNLVSNERLSQMDKLAGTGITIQPDREPFSTARIILLILLGVVVLSFTLELAFRRRRNKKAVADGLMPGHSKVFDENKLEIPAGLYYDRTHTWAFLEADGMVKTGIDDFLQHVTGPITSLGMKIPGSRISKGDQLCILIQNGKHLVIYAPVSGIIREHNTALSADSSMINTSPYSGGWIYRIEPTNWLREVVFLSMANKYRIWLNAEFTRLKDFLATAIKKDMPQFAPLVLQDGGALKDEVLSDLGPEIWEEFQTRFIDTFR